MSFDSLMAEAAEIQQSAIHYQVQRGVEQAGRAAGYAIKGLTEQAEKDFADIPGLFEPFSLMPDPAAYGPLIHDMGTAMRFLSTGQDNKDPVDGLPFPANPVMDRLPGTEAYIENWTGRAAEDFKRNFIDPFPALLSNQFLLGSVLKGGLAAHAEVWRRARNDIDKIATDTLAALDHMNDCGSNDWSMLFTVVGAVVSIAAVPVTDGASLYGLAFVGAAASVASSASGGGGGAERRFSGETAGAVISQMRQAISMLADDISGQERKIATAMTDSYATVRGSHSAFVSNRPLLAGANAGNVTTDAFLGYST
ncbi:MAG TPA: hypothetical protein VFR11_15405 [Micromonosporaceae bacterium]|nr:hypothetical protein [Micromonosporaceae bacterium]